LSTGKLYKARDGEFLAEVNYQLLDDSAVGWWGELTLTEYQRIKDGDGYMIELEDGCKGKCSLRKKVNKAVIGVPPLYYYHFKGRSRLK
jgi:hypothetical protein